MFLVSEFSLEAQHGAHQIVGPQKVVVPDWEDLAVIMSGSEAVSARVGMGEEEGRQGVDTLRSWLNKSMKVSLAVCTVLRSYGSCFLRCEG